MENTAFDYDRSTVRDMDGKTYLLCPLRGEALAGSPVFNKGTAFTAAEREEFGLHGLLPPRTVTMEEQAARVMSNYRAKADDLERYIHLISLLHRGRLLPPVHDIRRIEMAVARAVAKEVGYAGPIEPWDPAYLPYRPR